MLAHRREIYWKYYASLPPNLLYHIDDSCQYLEENMGFGDLFRATENAQLKQQTDELQQKNSELHQKSFELHRENFELHQENEELQQRISELVDMIPKESHDLLEIRWTYRQEKC